MFIATFNTISVMWWQSVLLMELQGVKNNKTSVSRTYQYTCIYTCSVFNQEEEAKATCTIVQQMVDQNFIKIY